MAGIYIHIPFCASKCTYCDFYSITNQKSKDDLIVALETELLLRKNYLGSETIDTVYFGGGTPSLFLIDELSEIIEHIKDNFKLNNNAEITLELNPDDATPEYLKELIKIGVNRLSIGVQSFDDKVLKFLNRRHNSVQSIQVIVDAKKAGFKNIGIDLIYGIPDMSTDVWQKSLEKAIGQDIQHISAYHLTIEQNTPLYKLVESNKVSLVDEEESIKQFEILIENTIRSGFEHYEISNFAKQGFISQHNSNYWRQKKYIGIGPSAHSYNIDSRTWNAPNIEEYIEQISLGNVEISVEILNDEQKYNDYIITALRTSWGIDLNSLKENFTKELIDNCFKNYQKFVESGHLLLKENKLSLTNQGMFISDTIISEMLSV